MWRNKTEQLLKKLEKNTIYFYFKENDWRILKFKDNAIVRIYKIKTTPALVKVLFTVGSVNI